MSVLMLLKIFSDCCICFAILASGPIAFGFPLLLPALICGATAGLATFFESKSWKTLRILCGFLPFICLLFGEGSGQVLVLSVPAVYTATVICMGKLELEYYSYTGFFRQSLWFLGIAYVIVLMWEFLTTITGKPVMLLDTGVMFRYVLVHIVCGIVLQRQLRLGAEQLSQSSRRQMTALLGAGAAIAFGFLVAEPLMRAQVLAIVKYALLALGIPIVFLIELVSSGMDWLAKRPTGKPGQSGQIGNGGTGMGGDSVLTPPATGEIPQEPLAPSRELDPVVIWGILVALLLIVAAVILYKSFQKQKNFVNVDRSTGFVTTRPKKKRTSALSNRHKVRQLYREFLRTENGHGLKLKINDTSEDVLRRIHPDTDKKSAAELRQVYLAARYDDRQNISKSQVNAAKLALKGTKSGKG